MTCMILRFSSRAVGYDPSRCRLSLWADTLFLGCFIRCMARNQIGGGNLLDRKTVPATSLHW